MKSRFFHLGLALFTAGVAVVGYWFWYAAITAESATVANLQKQIAVKTETAGRVASSQAALTEIAGNEAVVQNYFISGTDIVAFIEGLEAQGKAQGSATNVLSVSTGTANKRPTFILSLTIKGTFDAVMRTVGVIDYAPYDLSISEFSLAHDDTTSWQANLKLTVGASANTPITTGVPNTVGTSTP